MQQTSVNISNKTMKNTVMHRIMKNIMAARFNKETETQADEMTKQCRTSCYCF
jgi:hypothetical protein